MNESFDDENLKIYFEPGLCNLKEFTEMRVKNNIFWHKKMEELKGIMVVLIEYVIELANYEIYNTDLKL